MNELAADSNAKDRPKKKCSTDSGAPGQVHCDDQPLTPEKLTHNGDDQPPAKPVEQQTLVRQAPMHLQSDEVPHVDVAYATGSKPGVETAQASGVVVSAVKLPAVKASAQVVLSDTKASAAKEPVSQLEDPQPQGTGAQASAAKEPVSQLEAAPSQGTGAQANGTGAQANGTGAQAEKKHQDKEEEEEEEGSGSNVTSIVAGIIAFTMIAAFLMFGSFGPTHRASSRLEEFNSRAAGISRTSRVKGRDPERAMPDEKSKLFDEKLHAAHQRHSKSYEKYASDEKPKSSEKPPKSTSDKAKLSDEKSKHRSKEKSHEKSIEKSGSKEKRSSKEKLSVNERDMPLKSSSGMDERSGSNDEKSVLEEVKLKAHEKLMSQLRDDQRPFADLFVSPQQQEQLRASRESRKPSEKRSKSQRRPASLQRPDTDLALKEEDQPKSEKRARQPTTPRKKTLHASTASTRSHESMSSTYF